MEKQNSNYWSTDEVLRLIALVRANEAIYNPANKNYYGSFAENFWKEIDIRLGKTPGASLRKWTNLRNMFRKEYENTSSQGVKSKWMFFDKMSFVQPFLRKKRKAFKDETLDDRVQKALEQIESTRKKLLTQPTDSGQSLCPVEPSDVSAEECYDMDEPNSPYFRTERMENEFIDDALADCRNFNVEETPQICPDFKMEENPDFWQHLNFKETPKGCLRLDVEEAPHAHQRSAIEQYALESNDDTIDAQPQFNYFPDYDPKLNNKLLIHEIEEIPSSSRPLPQLRMQGGLQSTDSNRELCKCRTDPDAMFLMSLLPDMQSLSKKDKSSFKIHVQRLIQNLLYNNCS